LKPAESASPGGMTSAGAEYFVYNAASEGLAGRPGADGYAMSTVAGYVSYADAGSPLEQAVATNDSFAAFARVKRAIDSGAFEFVIGRTSGSNSAGAWSIGVSTTDHIVASVGGVAHDTGVVWSAGAWHEVGLSYDGSGSGDGQVLVYVDGRRVGAFQPGAIDALSYLHLGSGLAGANRFRGYYDHVEFWDKPKGDDAFAALGGAPAGDLPGDYDVDDDVDGADFLAWQRGFGSTATPAGSGADGNANGVIDAFDMGVWQANFGRTAPPQAASAASAPAIHVASAGFEDSKESHALTALLRRETAAGGLAQSNVKTRWIRPAPRPVWPAATLQARDDALASVGVRPAAPAFAGDSLVADDDARDDVGEEVFGLPAGWQLDWLR
jgi:hypothetical protein